MKQFKPNDHFHANVMLTGLPRSGTTLTCWLLNKIEDIVALHEPLQLANYPATKPILSILDEFVRETRVQLMKEGTAASYAMHGRIDTNPISNLIDMSQDRQVVHSHQNVDFGKQTTDKFQLAIKHNAPFTALVNEISSEYPVGVIIRNPLALMCSWHTVPLPIGEGRLPMAERYDNTLSRSLCSINDKVKRQLTILRWCFEKYQSVPACNIFKYEDIIASGGRQLSLLFPKASQLNLRLSSRNYNSIYPLELRESLTNALIKQPEGWDQFYTEEEVSSLARWDHTG
jgi:hypothetical protein